MFYRERMVKDGGHANYNANTPSGSRRSVTYPVAKMPHRLQKLVFEEVSIGISFLVYRFYYYML